MIDSINKSTTTTDNGALGSTNLGIVLAILAVIAVVIPIILGGLLPIFKPKLSANTMRYLYAFTAGFFIILSIFGFLNEALENVNTFIENSNIGEGTLSAYGISFGIIGITVTVVLLSALGVKYLISKRIAKKELSDHAHGIKKEDHVIIHGHSHDKQIFNLNDVNPKTKFFAVMLIASHKIPAGLTVGFLAAQYVADPDVISIAFLITFFLHIIPEELIFFYRQIDMGVSKWKAIGISTLFTLMFVPFLLIGGYTGQIITTSSGIGLNLLSGFLLSVIGALFLFTAIVEFLPEFLHSKMNARDWYLTVLVLLIGISIATMVIVIHHGAHAHEEHEEKLAIIVDLIKKSNINHVLKI